VRSHCGLLPQRGAELYGVATTYRRQGFHLAHPHGSSYEPQHLNLEEVAGKWGLTGEAVGVAAIDGVIDGNCG
jgi:hypothetical protein